MPKKMLVLASLALILSPGAHLAAQTRVAKIAFHSNRSGTSQIHVMNRDGTEVERLTSDSASNICPAISPDGSRIAFLSDREGENHIFLMNADGSEVRRLTNTPGEEAEPAWTADGNSIYYRAVKDDRTIIRVVNVGDGTVARELTDFSVPVMFPRISPDGTKIVFVSRQKGRYELWIMAVDGSNPHRIGSTADWAFSPCWSPDGKRIVYTHYKEAPSPFSSKPVDIHVINADGTGDTTIAGVGSVAEFASWSPDGEQIVFQAYQDENFEIFVVNGDGNNLRRLTTNAAFDGRASWGVQQH